MDIKEAISKVVGGESLSEEEMVEIMEQIMSGLATPAQIGAFLVALRLKGETIEEIAGAAIVMREKAVKIAHPHLSVVDTCGTGGDSSGTFNISTTAAFITAGVGLQVAKHGNRSVSSQSGSADVLKSLGVNIEADVGKVEKSLDKHGIAFLFAPLLHSAMKHAIGPRKEIGIRTIFNLLGPLTNPAGAKHQVIGVYSDYLTEPLANVLKRLGSQHVFVVHGSDGLDEATLTGPTKVSELKDGVVKNWTLNPEEFGFTLCKSEDLKGGDQKENATITLNILKGVEKGAKRDIAILNSALAIVAGEGAPNLKEAIALANRSVDNGAALKKLEELRETFN
ncbi:MAG: anthranilate phosphoribosyltransferase [Nitrospinota bacterium]|nr:anthranilate phosphoribosyltransferase [Nitrospinota bacterium]